MNKEIFFFRVWDKVNQKYLSTCDIAIDGEFNVFLWDMEYDEWTLFSPSYSIFERCTGLKDKNGRLIYEGDIVNLIPAETEDHKERIVIWLKDHWTTCKKSSWGANIYWTFGKHEIEIVGNIHEPKWGMESEVEE